jgi:uncharacterized protein (DUF2147 family)
MEKPTILYLFIIVFGLLLITISPSFSQEANDILGKWQDADHPEKQVEIVKHQDFFIGKVINDSSKNSKNGTIVFHELTWDSRDKSYSGTLINPDNKDKFGIKFKLEEKDSFHFTVSRFVFSKTLSFKRIP